MTKGVCLDIPEIVKTATGQSARYIEVQDGDGRVYLLARPDQPMQFGEAWILTEIYGPWRRILDDSPASKKGSL